MEGGACLCCHDVARARTRSIRGSAAPPPRAASPDLCLAGILNEHLKGSRTSEPAKPRRNYDQFVSVRTTVSSTLTSYLPYSVLSRRHSLGTQTHNRTERDKNTRFPALYTTSTHTPQHPRAYMIQHGLESRPHARAHTSARGSRVHVQAHAHARVRRAPE